MLTHSVANHNNLLVEAPLNVNSGSPTTRVHEFVGTNLPEFLGSQTGEDPHNFFDEIKKILDMMQVITNDRVEIAPYQLKYVFHIWYTQ